MSLLNDNSRDNVYLVTELRHSFHTNLPLVHFLCQSAEQHRPLAWQPEDSGVLRSVITGDRVPDLRWTVNSSVPGGIPVLHRQPNPEQSLPESVHKQLKPAMIAGTSSWRNLYMNHRSRWKHVRRSCVVPLNFTAFPNTILGRMSVAVWLEVDGDRACRIKGGGSFYGGFVLGSATHHVHCLNKFNLRQRSMANCLSHWLKFRQIDVSVDWLDWMEWIDFKVVLLVFRVMAGIGWTISIVYVCFV